MFNSTIEQLQSEIAELKVEVNRIKEEIAIVKEKQEAVEKNKKLGMCSQQWIGLQNQIVELTKLLGVKEDKLEKITPPFTQGLAESTIHSRQVQTAFGSIEQRIEAMEAITKAMIQCLIRTVKDAIGERAERLNIEVLKRLLDENWRQVFGRHITVSISARKLLGIDYKNKDFYDNFVDMKSIEQHEFFVIYSEALNHPEDLCGLIFIKVFTCMKRLSHRYIEMLEMGANLSQSAFSEDSSISIKRPRSITNSDSPAGKRFKQSYASSMSANSTSSSTNCTKSGDSDSDSAGSISYQSRRLPDMMIKDIVDNQIYFAGEIVQCASQKDDVLSHLKPHAFIFNQDDATRLSHSFGLINAHSSVELFYFEQRAGCLKRHLIATFDLLNPSDQMKLVTDMIILYYIICLVSANKTRRIEDYCPTICRRTCSLQFPDDGSVLKLIDLTSLESTFRLKDQRGHLEKLYKELKKGQKSSIVNALTCKSYNYFRMHQTLLVHLWPRGALLSDKFIADHIEQFITDVLAFLESLHSFGYVHGDIRRPNVVRIKDECGKETFKFVVIDYENIRPICNKVKASSRTCPIHKKRREDGTVTRSCASPSSDFKMLAEIMREVVFSQLESTSIKFLPIDMNALFSAVAEFKENHSLDCDANIIRGFLRNQQK